MSRAKGRKQAKASKTGWESIPYGDTTLGERAEIYRELHRDGELDDMSVAYLASVGFDWKGAGKGRRKSEKMTNDYKRLEGAVKLVLLIFKNKGMNDHGFNFAVKEVSDYDYDLTTAKKIVEYVMSLFPFDNWTVNEIIAHLNDTDLQPALGDLGGSILDTWAAENGVKPYGAD